MKKVKTINIWGLREYKYLWFWLKLNYFNFGSNNVKLIINDHV
jgi:hypothetical protein